MADYATGDTLQAILVIGGFLILGAAIAWAKLRNRVTPEQERRTEEATRQLYEEGTTEGRGGR